MVLIKGTSIMDIVVQGNTKLGKEVGVFNLPPMKTCTPTEWCAKWCYAMRGKHVFPNVKKGTTFRLKESKKKGFVDKAVKAIKGKYSYFRIHASGDFYSEEYVQKWIDIALRCPDTLFLAFTKRRDLEGPIKTLSKLPNVKIRESLDDSQQKPAMGLKFAAINTFKAPRRKEIIDCGDGCPECGYRCWHENKDVILHKH